MERTGQSTNGRDFEPFDMVLVGGGLQNGLIALAALDKRPGRRIALVERDATLGGNHTWCMHPADVPEAARSFVEPLIEKRWSGYEVRFPDLARTLEGPYAAITSERFAAQVASRIEAAPRAELYLGCAAAEVHGDRVVLEDGRVLRGRLIVDARGPEPEAFRGRAGYQKFVGLEIQFEQPHGCELPVLMDATVAQLDGYRFLYCLPLDETRMLVEDTRFSLHPTLDLDPAPVREYASRFGAIREVVRREHGVLPMPWAGETEPGSDTSPLLGGFRGGWFHPATGYSFPCALRLALHLATHDTDDALGDDYRALREQHASQASYAQRLNYLLFHGFDPEGMWNVFRRFYTLPPALIDRFYALSMSRTDRARLMIGSPPRGFRWSAALLGAARRLA